MNAVDLTYDPVFERVAHEIGKRTSLSSEPTNWRFVAIESERFLREGALDLRAMTWLVAARAELDGLGGIAEGLASLASVVRVSWPTLSPPPARVRARAAQIAWLWETLARRVAAFSATQADRDELSRIEATVDELGAFFAEALGDADPTNAPLRIVLRDKLREIAFEPAAIAPAAPEPTPSAAAPVVQSVAAVPSVDIAPSGGLEGAIDGARAFREPLMALAHHARREARTSAWPYRLLRVAAWMTVDRAPEVESSSARTFVRAPKQAERDELARLRAGGHWEALLDAAEEALSKHAFWLDLHEITDAALEALGAGGSYAEARAAVTAECIAFVRRVPGVAKLDFSNGTPFASPETLAWLARRDRQPSKSESSEKASPDSTSDELARLLETLDDRIRSSGADDAIAEALASIERLPGARDRFRGHLAVAERARAASRDNVATALVARLLPAVDATLERWEPALCAAVIAFALEGRDEDEALFGRLLALDPRLALRLRH